MNVTRQSWKSNDTTLYDYIFTEEGKKLQIIKTSDGNLYWLMDDTEPSDYATFTITGENETIYALFSKLYSSIMDNKDFNNENTSNQMSIQHYMLTKDGNITWVSDKDEFDETSLVRMSKVEDDFQLEFVHQRTNFPLYYKPGMFDICFSKDNSRYAPLNNHFFQMYEELNKYDPEFHQVHLKEIEYQLKKSK